MTDPPVLEVADLRVEFPTSRGLVRAIDGVSLTVRRGEILGIVGESGSGKSVTAKSIMRLVRPPGRIVGGRVCFQGRDLLSLPEREMRALRGSALAMIFQNPIGALDPVFSVESQLCEVFKVRPEREEAVFKGGLRAAAVEVLRRVRIPSPETVVQAYPHQLSGGMAQRVMIGMGVAGRPALLIADEPTTALDVSVQAQILELLRSVRDEYGTSIILITHDLAITAQLCDRVAVMYAGQVVESGRTRDLFHAPRHHYTRGLLRSVPRLGQRRNRLDQIGGQPPDLRTLPLGCRFAPRCERAEERCHAERPLLEPIGENRLARCHFPVEFPPHPTASPTRGTGVTEDEGA